MDLINRLIDCNCVKIGKFTLRNGDISRYYFDMKNLISHPKLLSQVGDLMYELIRDRCDVICGVPMGGLPLATYISTKYHIPMIIPRKSVKGYGMGKQIEGEYSKDTTCIIIEDVITTGKSSMECVKLIKNSKAKLVGFASIIDRSTKKNLRINKKIISHLKINVPTYKKNKLPNSLKSIPITTPGSRYIK